ncbi:hypothetical protein [Bradyrhizobium sp. JYMT SZCCT0180]|uniref:hypothetical protein n=1 Tax=Bradyrhizobium sp. JYMT SZCCT0180 TaxID=2807666 RepID=UPI001BAADC2D|nr:hypothetical protein [Bradyrhizobium sp. JYMT SZCCT0180]MBR1209895.1 hypothetical protein [Bradyrhizobium sp. JYMT SZCCT0180]
MAASLISKDAGNLIIEEEVSSRQLVLQNVNHDGPCRDPAAFTAAVFEFLSGLE